MDSPIPTPEPDQVVTKVVVSGSNPKDWKMPDFTVKSFNTGDDIAGVVYSVGSNVVEFKRGDRVAALHQMRAPGGSYAEYAVSWDHTTFHLPKTTTFEGWYSSSAVVATHRRLIHLRGRYHPTSFHDCSIWSLPASRPSTAVAPYHYTNPCHYLRCRRSCCILCDQAGPSVQHPPTDLCCWKRYTACGKAD